MLGGAALWVNLCPSRGGAVSRFIVIEGLIGVGKTSLCRLLEEALGASLVLEPAATNPFLGNFYSDPERFAFPAQMYYLANRYAQYSELQQPDMFTELVVADYLWEKDRLFAEHTLKDEELELYTRFADLLGLGARVPEFILFLDAPTEVVTQRISRRAIAAEQVIDPDYLDTLRERYHALWEDYDAAPVYVLDTQSIDYVDDPAGRQLMLDMIRGWLNGKPIDAAPPAYGTDSSQLDLFNAS